MNFEALRTLAKRVQVRIGVLEEVLEEIGIMDEAKRADLYLKHSAAYDQDEARTLESEDDLRDLESEHEQWPDELDELDGGELSIGDALPIWALCGCNSCHSNIIENLKVSDAVEYWEYTHEIAVPNSFDVHGARSYPISEDDYEEWIDCIQHLVPVEIETELLEDHERTQPPLCPKEDAKNESLHLFGEGVFVERCETGDNERDLAYEALEELMAIIGQPVSLFGSESQWRQAVRQAADKLKFK